MSFWKNLFGGSKLSLKRKPGGTMVGNFLRSAVSGATNGQFGQGNMMLQDGETKEEANARLLQAAGSGASAFNDALPNAANGSTPADTFKSGVIMQKVKSFALPVLGVVAAIFLGIKIFKRKGKSKM